MGQWNKQAAQKQREYRRRTGNKATRKYEKTPKGFLMRSYRNMESRVRGVSKPGSWRGKKLLPREEFYEWSLGSSHFWTLFKAWVASSYDHRLSPSVNRIDSRRGYELDNMEWTTHSINSAMGARSPLRHSDAKQVAREVILGHKED